MDGEEKENESEMDWFWNTFLERHKKKGYDVNAENNAGKCSSKRKR